MKKFLLKPIDHEVERFSLLKDIEKRIRISKVGTEEDLNRVEEIYNDFFAAGNKMGMAFAEKVKSFYFIGEAEKCDTLDAQLQYIEKAHDCINHAVIVSEKHVQPSLFKHQGRIKSLLSVYHFRHGDFHQANILQTDASRILGRLIYEYPDYPEARLEYATAQLRKVPGTLKRILFEVEKAHSSFLNPAHKKHLPSAIELSEYEAQIKVIKDFTHHLISITNNKL